MAPVRRIAQALLTRTLLMHQETELKFVGDERALGALRQSEMFLDFAGYRNATTVVRCATYYDTEDHALREAGYVLRVRGEGNVHSQTLKRVGSGELVTRAEYKSEIDGIRPDLSSIPDSRARWKVTHLLAGRSLEPIFEVDTRRTRVLLTPARNVEIEAAIDTGEIRLASESQRRIAISEVEFELVRGGMNDLLATARLLTRGLPLTLSFLSKPERGFRLAQDESLGAWKPGRIQLRSAQTADDALASIIGNCVRHLLNNLDAVAQGHSPEGVHQMRVALRRLRVAVSLLSSRQRSPFTGLMNEVRDLARELGACRDKEVLLNQLTLPVARQLGRDDAFEPLVLRLEQARDASWQGAISWISSERFRNLALDLVSVMQQRPWLSNPNSHRDMEADAQGFARAQVRRRLLQSRKALRRAGKMRADDLHALRISLKKLRYTLEFFDSLEARGSARLILRKISRLQDVLGDMNDVLVAKPQLRTILAESRADDDATAVSLAGGMVLGWHGRRYATKRRRVRRRLKSLAGMKMLRKAR
jgi:inorganic triphosphatase YgiF